MSRHTPTRSVPILTDNSLNRAFAVKYAIYSLFGLSGLITHIPSIAAVVGEVIATFLAGVVFISSALASVSAWHSVKGGAWVKRELYATIVLVSFVAVYNITLIYLAAIGSTSRINLAIIASALLVMPIWRIRYILKKSRP